jgi:probable HAF family extracellular repeat protein
MRRNPCFSILLACGLIACDDSVLQPPDTSPETTSAALVPGEYWQVLTVAQSDELAVAKGINDSGVIVGTIVRDGYSRAFRYSPGTITTYPASSANWMNAEDINESGQIVGSTLVNDTVRAYVRLADGTVQLLPHYGSSGTENYGIAINDVGEVAGQTGDRRGVRWGLAIGGWKAFSLGIPLQKPLLAVKDINNSGWIVGTASAVDVLDFEAFLYRPGHGLQFLGTLGGGVSSADAVNKNGRVLGGSQDANGDARYFIWTSFGGMVDQGPWSDVVDTYAALSDKGRIVGTVNGGRTFTVYKGIYHLLPLPAGGEYSQVLDVNSCGVIVGHVAMNDGTSRAVRWRRVVGKNQLPICD